MWKAICENKRITTAIIFSIIFGVVLLSRGMYQELAAKGCNVDPSIWSLIGTGIMILFIVTFLSVLFGMVFYHVSLINEVPRRISRWLEYRRSPEYLARKKYGRWNADDWKEFFIKLAIVTGIIILVFGVLPYFVAYFFWLIYC